MITIIFEDHGQDFFEWDLDEDGVVVGCRPFQAEFWCGCLVLNFDELEVGGKVDFTKMEIYQPREMKYPIKEIKDGNS